MYPREIIQNKLCKMQQNKKRKRSSLDQYTHCIFRFRNLCRRKIQRESSLSPLSVLRKSMHNISSIQHKYSCYFLPIRFLWLKHITNKKKRQEPHTKIIVIITSQPSYRNIVNGCGSGGSGGGDGQLCSQSTQLHAGVFFCEKRKTQAR